MTTEPATSRLQDNSLLGLGAGLVAAVAAAYVCKLAGFPPEATPGVVAVAGGVPAGVTLRIKSRRRDTNVDIARIQRGELRRPVALVVMLLAAAIVLIETAYGLLVDGFGVLIRSGKIGISTAQVVEPLVTVCPLMLIGICYFLVASYTSHYLGKYPYLWTAAAVGCALVVRALVVWVLWESLLKSAMDLMGFSRPIFLLRVVGFYLVVLIICMVGVWLGRRYHDEFLAKKLARVKGNAAREAAKQHQSTLQNQTTATQASTQDSSAPQNSAPKLVTLISRPNDLPSAPDNHRTSDPIKQIEKLAHLRDTAALTHEEFQAKKTELLCRI
jgi:hypothetical protein